jgi:PAS domain S-box-containing protein
MPRVEAPHAQLEQQLAEAEATIEALLSGQIDAVIDATSRTPVLLATAQEALRQSEERYRLIVETANEGIWQMDAEQRTTFMNRRMAELLGCESDMGLGRTPFEFLDGEGRVALAGHVASPRAHQTEVRFTHRDGSSVWTLLEATPITDDAGSFQGSLVMVMDITDRRAAEAALRTQEEQYREIVEASNDGIIKVDVDSRIVFVNRRFAETFGYEPAEMVGADMFTFLSPAAAIGAEQAFARRGRGESDAFDSTILHRNGTEVPVHIAGSPLYDAEGRNAGSLAIVRDVTEQRKLQAQLMMSDRMASVGTLAAGVAHEINNPLTAVVANLDYIVESLRRFSVSDPAQSPAWREAWFREEIKGPLDDAREAAQRVRFIVQDLKILSRSPEEAPQGSVDVRSIMESSLRMAWNEIRHRAQLVKDYGDIPRVAANEARLGQVFLNLVINAAQAMPEGRAEHNRICVSTRLEEDRVVIEVGDTGTGIPAEAIGRVFDAFYTTKAVGVGTGLGLAICQRIVTDMGGLLTVKSALGKGSTFRVSLPRASAASVVDVAPAPIVPAARRGRILVVDDEEPVLRALTRLLSNDHEIVTAQSALKALSLIGEGERFDLILCDLMMPDMTGMELHGELTRVAPEQAQRMIFLTGGVFTKRAGDFLAESGRVHVAKPFDTADLRAIIARHLQDPKPS